MKKFIKTNGEPVLVLVAIKPIRPNIEVRICFGYAKAGEFFLSIQIISIPEGNQFNSVNIFSTLTEAIKDNKK